MFIILFFKSTVIYIPFFIIKSYKQRRIIINIKIKFTIPSIKIQQINVMKLNFIELILIIS